MRVAAAEVRSEADADHGLGDVVCNVAATHHAMHPGRFADDLIDAPAWNERGAGILTDPLERRRRFLGAGRADVTDLPSGRVGAAVEWRETVGEHGPSGNLT